MMEPNEIVRAPMVHELKCWPEYYDAVERGDKPFEIRKWDRPYQVGDTLLLQEYDPEKQDYTGRQIKRKVTYLLDISLFSLDTTLYAISRNLESALSITSSNTTD